MFFSMLVASKIDLGDISRMGDSDVGDLKLVTVFGFWWQNFDVDDIFGMLMTDANVKR